MLVTITLVVMKCELLLISLRTANIYRENVRLSDVLWKTSWNSYILMASVCKDDNWQRTQNCQLTLPLYDPQGASVGHRVTFGEMSDHEYDQVSN